MTRIASTPPLRLDDVEAQKSKPRAVANGGDAANGSAIEFGEKEPLRIVFETARMYKNGSPKMRLERCFGIATFEIG